MSAPAVTLSKRLAAAADAVREGHVIADVGCDHGKLSAFLLLSGKTPFCYATDIRPMPLSSARGLLESLGLSAKSRCMLTNGLDGVPADEVQDVVIAGIGFDVTAGIISAAPWLKDGEKQLVLVPASRHERMRRFLAAEGFCVLNEQAVAEAGHHYTVITARYDGAARVLNEWQARMGDIDIATPDGDAYRKAVRRRMQKIVDSAGDRHSAEIDNARQFLLLDSEI